MRSRFHSRLVLTAVLGCVCLPFTKSIGGHTSVTAWTFDPSGLFQADNPDSNEVSASQSMPWLTHQAYRLRLEDVAHSSFSRAEPRSNVESLFYQKNKEFIHTVNVDNILL